MENVLSEKEIEYLLNLEKYYSEEKTFKFPSFGGRLSIPLSSADKNENFILDISRSNINISKNTFQNRVRKSIVLLRLDINSAPHRNPDGKVLSGNHLHIYKEGSRDKFAYELPPDFNSCTDASSFLEVFMDYCKITIKPIIEEDLFV